jgi:hypothetical protein
VKPILSRDSEYRVYRRLQYRRAEDPMIINEVRQAIPTAITPREERHSLTAQASYEIALSDTWKQNEFLVYPY